MSWFSRWSAILSRTFLAIEVSSIPFARYADLNSWSMQHHLPRVYLALMWALTLPYYRYFQVNTLSPIQRISKYASQHGEQEILSRLLFRWRTRKLEELRFITIAVSFITLQVKSCKLMIIQVCCTGWSSDRCLLLDRDSGGILARNGTLVLLSRADNPRNSACGAADIGARDPWTGSQRGRPSLRISDESLSSTSTDPSRPRVLVI